jgi:diguanylate cyclase (GGDEF)-like protein
VIDRARENQDAEVIHDYAKCDDDMFLYSFALALLNCANGDSEEALVNFERAERFLAQSEGNQFFCYCIFRQKRMELFEELGKSVRYENEKMLLEQREAMNRQIADAVPDELLAQIELSDRSPECRISQSEVEALLKQESTLRDYNTAKRQMDFISAWQKLVDVSDTDVETMVQNAMSVFCTRFGLDNALYLVYEEQQPRVLYNDTDREVTGEMLLGIQNALKGSPQGFAVSKISDGFFEHQDVISYFGVDEVCSFAAVPFQKNGVPTSLLIVYVRMKDNWHGSFERYMLNADDLHIYRLLFMELEHAINRMDANAKIYEMNQRLQEAASTDMLTGICNRAGMYKQIHRMSGELERSGGVRSIGLMFIDLDNFKHYNDTYGHNIGDLVLKEMAAVFREAAQGRGFVSRFGGDEFIIILTTCDRAELESIAGWIYQQIEATNGFQAKIEAELGERIKTDPKSRISCSIGIAQAQNVRREEDINRLISQADNLMYSVKTVGKGRYAFL